MAQTSRRCSACRTNWPDFSQYALCPVCREPTTRFLGLGAISEEEARSRQRHAEFEWYYKTQHVPDSDLEGLNMELAGLSEGPVPPA